MTYQPLARKYRPSRFSELVGQDAVGKALTSAIALGREPHAVLFTGVRGVGKTTVARLYAKALNCEARAVGFEPCNACASCLAITSGRHEDVLEIDGASNTGVGDVRALQETVEYVPRRSSYKVYIIDEVHMLSQAAFNALLKTLEEPPSHVVFVFATTELARVPATILSRCQAFYLRKLPNAVIKARLADILAQEGVKAEDKALAVIAREGHGSMRDALTLLDQAMILGGGAVTVAGLGPIVSNLSSSPYLDLLHAMVSRDAGRALARLAALDQAGAELSQVCEDTANLARHGFVVQGLGEGALDVGLLGLDDGEVQRLKEIAALAKPFDLNRIFRTLVKARTELDGSALDRYVFENYVYEWCFDPGLPEVDQLLAGEDAKTPAQRVELPRAGAVATPKASTVAQPAAAQPVPPTQPAPVVPVVEKATGPAEFPATWRQLVDAWREKKPLSARKLEEAHPVAYGKDKIVLAVSDTSYASKGLLQKDEQIKIRDQFKELFGFTGQLVVSTLAAKPASEPAPVAAPSAPIKAEAPLPETVLTSRTREADDRRQKLKEEAVKAPFTQDLLQALGGTIEDVRILDGDHK